MKIAVCVKQVPDTEAKIKLKPDNSGIDYAGIKWVLNPYDEHAVEEGIKLRDANPGSQVIVFSCGPKARVGEALRTALAMGADEGVLIDAQESADNLQTAMALASALQKEGPFDLVLSGKLAIDDNSSAVSQMLAEKLGVPHATVVTKLTVSGGKAVAEREVEGGTKEVFELTLPALIAANKGLNMPRYPSLPGIMKAKKKVLKEYDFAGLGVSGGPVVVYKNYQLPKEKPAVKILSGSASDQSKELGRLLRDEAKVL